MNRQVQTPFSQNQYDARKAVFIVAELSGNHNQSLERAMELVRAAAEAGADAVKLQTYTADTVTIQCQNPLFVIDGTIWNGRTFYDLYAEAFTPWEWHAPLQAYARELGLVFFSTPFDFTAVDFLEELQVPLYKIASFELVDIPLLQKTASTGKPVIVSTGMASLAEIDEAVTTLRAHGAGPITLLKCTSSYPAPAEDANLRTIPVMAQAFDCAAGLSDHTMGSAVAIAAVTLGAEVVEKHFTLSRRDGGPDDSFSMEPDEFARMVKDIRQVECALGKVSFALTPKEHVSKTHRRSLFAVENIKAGERITETHVRSIRPGHGMHTRHLPEVLGRKAARDIQRGEPMQWDMLG